MFSIAHRSLGSRLLALSHFVSHFFLSYISVLLHFLFSLSFSTLFISFHFTSLSFISFTSLSFISYPFHFTFVYSLLLPLHLLNPFYFPFIYFVPFHLLFVYFIFIIPIKK